jgi:hypothetical protein
MYELLDLGGVVGVNYGYGKVRYPAAVESVPRRSTCGLARKESRSWIDGRRPVSIFVPA